MVTLGDCPDDFQRQVRAKCSRIHELLLNAARPVLQHGMQNEVTWFVYRGPGHTT